MKKITLVDVLEKDGLISDYAFMRNMQESIKNYRDSFRNDRRNIKLLAS